MYLHVYHTIAIVITSAPSFVRTLVTAFPVLPISLYFLYSSLFLVSLLFRYPLLYPALNPALNPLSYPALNPLSYPALNPLSYPASKSILRLGLCSSECSHIRERSRVTGAGPIALSLPLRLDA